MADLAKLARELRTWADNIGVGDTSALIAAADLLDNAATARLRNAGTFTATPCGFATIMAALASYRVHLQRHSETMRAGLVSQAQAAGVPVPLLYDPDVEALVVGLCAEAEKMDVLPVEWAAAPRNDSPALKAIEAAALASGNGPGLTVHERFLAQLRARGFDVVRA